jgi:hypothetical protein
MKLRYAVLDESGNVIPATLIEWGMWCWRKDRQRIIQQDEIAGYLVSTVFVGVNMAFSAEAPPLWFETMVFADPEIIRNSLRREEASYQRCYTTLAEAKAGHMDAINWLRINKLARGRPIKS